MLTLQRLLENVIYHGIQSLPEGGLVTVVIQQDQGNLEVTITNPAVSEDHSHERAGRMVLENIRHCLVAV